MSVKINDQINLHKKLLLCRRERIHHIIFFSVVKLLQKEGRNSTFACIKLYRSSQRMHFIYSSFSCFCLLLVLFFVSQFHRTKCFTNYEHILHRSRVGTRVIRDTSSKKRLCLKYAQWGLMEHINHPNFQPFQIRSKTFAPHTGTLNFHLPVPNKKLSQYTGIRFLGKKLRRIWIGETFWVRGHSVDHNLVEALTQVCC